MTVEQRRDVDLVKRKLLLNDPWYQLILNMVNSVGSDFGEKRVMEIGCGFGGFCIRMAEKGASVVGLDISLSAVREAKNLVKQTGVHRRVDFVVGDAQSLPFRDQSSGIVVCSETLEHVPNYEQSFDELVRVTEKKGFLCVTVPNLLSTFFLECIITLSIGQPKYVRRFFSVEKEHVLHIFSVKRLFRRNDLKVERIEGTDLFHLSLLMRRTFRREEYLRVPAFIRTSGLEKLFGATIGVLARRK